MTTISCILTTLGVLCWGIAGYTVQSHLPSPPLRSWVFLALGIVLILAGLACACFITPAQQ